MLVAKMSWLQMVNRRAHPVMTRTNPSSLMAVGREEQSVSDTLSDARACGSVWVEAGCVACLFGCSLPAWQAALMMRSQYATPLLNFRC